MKKLKIIMLFILILSPSIASAKLLKLGEGENVTYLNETTITDLRAVKKGCEISYLSGNVGMKWKYPGTCEEFIEYTKMEVSNK